MPEKLALASKDRMVLECGTIAPLWISSSNQIDPRAFLSATDRAKRSKAPRQQRTPKLSEFTLKVVEILWRPEFLLDTIFFFVKS